MFFNRVLKYKWVKKNCKTLINVFSRAITRLEFYRIGSILMFLIYMKNHYCMSLIVLSILAVENRR